MIGTMRRKLRVLASLPWRDRGLVVEAALLLAAARAALALLSFRRLDRWLRSGRGQANDAVLPRRVSRAVAIASRNVPFAAVCLPQALAANAMLARRGVAASLVIAAGRGRDDAPMLHSWLEAGGVIVTGEAGRSAATPVVRYR